MDRRHNILFFAAVVFILAGCGDDDPKIQSKLVGTWNVKAKEIQITVPGGDLHLYLVATLGMLPEQADMYEAVLESGDAYDLDVTSITFKNDGTYETKVSGSTPTSSGKWEISSDEKTVTVDKGTDHEDVVPVTTLTDTSLVIGLDFSDEIDLPQMKYVIVLTLERA